MIKKFEQFVNERYYDDSQRRATKDRELLDYLYSIGFEREITTHILKQSQKVGFSYTQEEAENIFKRLPNCETLEDKVAFVISNFFTDEYDTDGVFTYDWCKETHCPIIRGLNGKLLTGKVYYSEFLNGYAESEEDLYDFGYDDMCDHATLEDGILDDDLPDYIDNNWDSILDITDVNLDEEFDWVEK
jgi:hypothetical protein